MRELLKQMNPWWETTFPFSGIPREKYLHLLHSNTKNKDIILITGLRRIGKTTLMKQHIFRLIKEGIEPKKICYITLDAYAFNKSSIQELVQLVREIHGLRVNEKLYLFLDEVTHKASFKQELKNLYDLGTTKIFASASSASLLVDHKAFLTGRSIILESLDFQEFLKFKKREATGAEGYLLKKYFTEYMRLGGIPEYILTEDPTYLTSLIDNIIYKDIIAVHGLKKHQIIKELFVLLCERVGKIVSYNKLGKVLGISKDTVKEYVHLFEQTHLFHIVEKRGKLNERLLEGKKIYCADVGIRNIITGYRDKGAIYENLVFNKVKAQNPRYVKVDGYELDFYFDNTLVEAKFNQELEGKQKELFDQFKAKKKIVATGVDFFL